MNDFSGKTVIVTGGAKGIGEGVTRAFAQAGQMYSAPMSTRQPAPAEAERIAARIDHFRQRRCLPGGTCEALVLRARRR